LSKDRPAAKRILVVEDDAGIREGLSDILILEGCQVDGAANGEEGLALLRSAPRPGLILLDLVMPVMNGAQFLAYLRQDRSLADMPVVLMSAAMPGAAALPRADAYLSKPFDIADLLEAIERHCLPPGGRPPLGPAALS
jgi:two-component system chemotaxis response regulator CheY